VRIFTQPCCACDESVGGNHRILKNAVADAIYRQPPVVVENLDPESDRTCRRYAQGPNQPDLKWATTHESGRSGRILPDKPSVRHNQLRFEVEF
jgi:hypothetical protein